MFPVALAADSPTARVLCALRYPSQTTWRVMARQLPSQLATSLESALAHHGACLCDVCAACVVSGAAAACAAGEAPCAVVVATVRVLRRRASDVRAAGATCVHGAASAAFGAHDASSELGLACVAVDAAARCDDGSRRRRGGHAEAAPSDGLGRLVRGLCKEFPGLEERLERGPGYGAGVESVLPSRRRVRVEEEVPQDPRAHTQLSLSSAATAGTDDARATFAGHLAHGRYAAAFDDLVYAYLLAEGGGRGDERSRSGTQTLFSLLGELCRSKEVASGMAQYLIEQDRRGCPHRGTVRTTRASCSDDPITLRGLPAGVAVCPAQLDGVRVGVLRRDEPPLPVARRLAPFLSGGSEDGGGGGGGGDDDDCGQDVVWVVLDDYKRVALPTRALEDPVETENNAAEGRSWVDTRVSLQWTHDALANTVDATWRSMLRGDAAVQELYATKHKLRYCAPPDVLSEPSRSLASVLPKEAYDTVGIAFVQGLSEANPGNVQGSWVRLLVHPAGLEPVVLSVPPGAVEVVPARVQDFVLAYVAIARGCVLVFVFFHLISLCLYAMPPTRPHTTHSKEKVLRDILDQKCLDIEQVCKRGHLTRPRLTSFRNNTTQHNRPSFSRGIC